MSDWAKEELAEIGCGLLFAIAVLGAMLALLRGCVAFIGEIADAKPSVECNDQVPIVE